MFDCARFGIVETRHGTSLQGGRMRYALAIQIKCRQKHRAEADTRHISEKMEIKIIRGL